MGMEQEEFKAMTVLLSKKANKTHVKNNRFHAKDFRGKIFSKQSCKQGKEKNEPRKPRYIMGKLLFAFKVNNACLSNDEGHKHVITVFTFCNKYILFKKAYNKLHYHWLAGDL